MYIVQDIMEEPWVVEFYETTTGRPVLFEELRDLLTPRQRAKFWRDIRRLETHGPHLDADYFHSVRGSETRLGEFRLTLDTVEFRLLFSLAPQRKYLMLVAYKEKKGDIPRPKIRTAEQRLREWRTRHCED